MRALGHALISLKMLAVGLMLAKVFFYLKLGFLIFMALWLLAHS